MIFNPSKIVKVLEVHPRKNEGNDFLCLSPVVEYNVTDGIWRVLQTEKDYIVLGADGVKTYDVLPFTEPEYHVIEQSNTSNDTDERFITFDTMLFTGERLLYVTEEENRFRLQFDDFKMYVNPYDRMHFTYYDDSLYLPFHCYDRYLRKRCSCGGKAELMFDHVNDFFIRCDSCHRRTYSFCDLEGIIDDWNQEALELQYITAEEDFRTFLAELEKPIDYIAAGGELYRNDKSEYYKSVIVSAKGQLYEIASQRTDENQFGFSYQRISDFNPEIWPDRITASDNENFTLECIEDGPGNYQTMVFHLDDKTLLLTACEKGKVRLY